MKYVDNQWRKRFMGLAMAAACLAGAPGHTQQVSRQLIATPLKEEARPVALELVFVRPPGLGPFPTLVFNHGSVSNGDDSNEVTHTVTYADLASYFNERGWLVVFPQRRGRGKSEGRYAEGWKTGAGRYTCDPQESLIGLNRAMQDMDAVMHHLQQRPEVNAQRLLIGGHSKGGILSMVYAAAQPGRFAGVLNFVGGWVGERCATADIINGTIFAKSAEFRGTTLWLYGERDAFYSTAHSRKNYAAFTAAGGQGAFHLLSAGAGKNDHQLVRNREPWAGIVTSFLERLPEIEYPAP